MTTVPTPADANSPLGIQATATAATVTAPQTDHSPKTISAKFNRLIRKAQGSLLVERFMPKALPPLLIGGAFLTASWLGLWHVLPLEAKIIGVVAFAAAAAISPLIVKSGSLLVSRKDAAKRIDELSGDHTRPARTLNDKLGSAGPKDPQAEAIWTLHLSRIWDKWAGRLQAGSPKPDLNKRDRYKLRYIVPVCVALSAVVAGEQRNDRLAEAFDWTAPVVPVAPLEVRAWVTPPTNIQTAPIYLRTNASAPAPATDGTDNPANAGLAVHKQSVLTVVVNGGTTRVLVNGEEVPVHRIIRTRGQTEAEASIQYEAVLREGDVTVVVENGPTWSFTVAPDNSPAVAIQSIEPVSPENGNTRARLDPVLHGAG